MGQLCGGAGVEKRLVRVIEVAPPVVRSVEQSILMHGTEIPVSRRYGVLEPGLLHRQGSVELVGQVGVLGCQDGHIDGLVVVVR